MDTPVQLQEGRAKLELQQQQRQAEEEDYQALLAKLAAVVSTNAKIHRDIKVQQLKGRHNWLGANQLQILWAREGAFLGK